MAPSTKYAFPPTLLEQSAQARLDYFKAYTVAHPALVQADQAVWHALREPAGALLVFVFGPTGVGKTTLLAHVEKRLLQRAESRLAQDPGYLPVVRLEAIAPANRQFKWRDFYLRALAQMDEPLIDYKRDRSTMLPVGDAMRQRSIVPRGGIVDGATLRLAWESALKHRRTDAVLIDEAQHIAKIAHGAKLLDQLDHLKSLATMTNTVHVLAGTYEILAFRHLSAQLARRSIDVHFPRYRATHEQERHAFKSVVWAFQQHLPLEEPPPLVHDWQYCYTRTIGCVGLLKDWLTRALADALESGAPTLSSEVLERHAFSLDRCDAMATESEEGEHVLIADAEANDRLRLRLGLLPSYTSRASRQAHGTEAQAIPSSARVGQRRPGRDPVKGGERTDGEQHG
jgi:hypothetical protein